jgi:anti-anti-sigma factor
MPSSSFPMETEIINGRLVLTPGGREITFKNTRDFLKKAKLAVAESGDEVSHFILDLRNIEIVDSVSLGSLVAIFKYVRDRKGELVIANASEPIRDLFELLHFTNVFKVHETLEDALRD